MNFYGQVKIMDENSAEQKFRLFNKDFVLLWAGQIVSSMGNSIQYIAVMWWIMNHFSNKESGIVMGLMFTFSVIPMAIIGPFAGVLNDRMSRKSIVILSDFLRGLLILWMAYLAYTNTLTALLIYLISALMGIGGAFFNPAIQSTIPNMVPDKHLTRANSLYQTGMQFTQIIGPAIGGLLVGFFGPFFVFMLNGFSFIVSAGTEIFINFRQNIANGENRNSFFTDFKEGFKFLYNQKLLFWAMIIVSVLNFAFSPLDILIAKQIKEIYHLGALELGYTVSAFAIGMMVGSVFLSLIPEIKVKHNFIIIGAIISGTLFAIFGFAPNLMTFLVIAFLIGLALAFVNVLFQVIIQRLVPDEKRGRVFSVMLTFETMLQPISLSVIGIMSSILSNAIIFMTLGTIIVIFSSLFYLVPGVKEV
uniref:MFS transporter n=1 Tax=Mesoaciditoga lauensis TaxID=1495039 RepID=A0A7V3RDZ1_9BACT